MKKNLSALTKRISVFALAVLLVFSLTACDSFERRLTGFTEAVTFMIGEANLSSSALITIRLSDDAAPVSLAAFLNTIGGMTTGCMTMIEDINGIEINLAVETIIYGDGMKADIRWIGPDGEEDRILSMIYIGEDFYISMVAVRLLESVTGSAILPAGGGAEYLHIRVPAMVSLSEFYSDGFGAYLANIDIPAAMSKLRGGMSATLENAIEQFLTEDFDKMLQEKDGEYILTLNSGTAISFARAVLRLLTAYSEEAVEFAADMAGMFSGREISAEKRAAAEESLLTGASRALAFMDSDRFINNVPAINFEYRVKATGEGREKVQTASTRLEIPAETMEMLNKRGYVPFDKFELIITELTAIQLTPVTAPQAQVISFDELFGGAMAGIISAAAADRLETRDTFTLPGNADLEQAMADMADMDLNRVASDFGIDLSRFNIDLNDIDMAQIEGLINSFGFGR